MSSNKPLPESMGGPKPVNPAWVGVRVVPNAGLTGIKKAVATGKTVHVSREAYQLFEPLMAAREVAEVVARLERMEILMLPELSPAGYRPLVAVARRPL